jgi:hypothetical protein
MRALGPGAASGRVPVGGAPGLSSGSHALGAGAALGGPGLDPSEAELSTGGTATAAYKDASRRSFGAVIAVGGGVAVLGIVAALLFRGPMGRTGPAALSPVGEDPDLYRDRPPLVTVPQVEIPSTKRPGLRPAAGERRPAATGAAAQTPAEPAAGGGAGGLAAMYRDASKGGDLSPGERGGVGRGSGSDEQLIAETVRRNTSQAKICYERTLKRDPSLRQIRVDVSLTVGLSGMVKEVKLKGADKTSDLDECLRSSVRRWRFPPGSEEYPVQFPLLFQGH